MMVLWGMLGLAALVSLASSVGAMLAFHRRYHAALRDLGDVATKVRAITERSDSPIVERDDSLWHRPTLDGVLCANAPPLNCAVADIERVI